MRLGYAYLNEVDKRARPACKFTSTCITNWPKRTWGLFELSSELGLGPNPY